MAFERRYFGTDGIRGQFGTPPITPEFFFQLGYAVGQVMLNANDNRVVIGMDTRASGTALALALAAGLKAANAQVIQLGIMPTPGVAFLTQHTQAQVGMVISASHNPYQDNGIKFFDKNGQKLSDTREQAIEAALSQTTPNQIDLTQFTQASASSDYALAYSKFCQRQVDEALTGLDLIVDCAHGAMSPIAPGVLRALGANVTTLACEPNGENINHYCGSTAPEALQQAVLKEQAAVGVAFDGDGDRVIMVDEHGELVDGDELLYIIAQRYRRQNLLEGGVVGTLMSNFGLEQAFLAQNIPFRRAKVGDRYVMDVLREKGWCLGGESSGHIICLDKTSTGDGLIAALLVLAEIKSTGKSLSQLKKGMQKSAQILINVSVRDKEAVLNSVEVLAAHDACAEQLGSQGRLLLRPSGTEALVRVMVEGESQALIEPLARHLAQVIEKEANRAKAQ